MAKPVMVYSKRQFTLPEGRIEYAPGLWEKSAFAEGQKEKYQCRVIIPETADLSKYKEEMEHFLNTPEMAAFVTKRGSAAAEQKKARGYTDSEILYTDMLKPPHRRELEEEVLKDKPYLKNQLRFSAKTPDPVVIIDRFRKPIPPEQRTQINSGDYVIMAVTLGCAITSSQLFLQLKAVQWLRPGEPIGRSGADLAMFETFNDEPSLDLGL